MIFSQKITMRRALRIHSHSHAGCTRLTLSAGEKKITYAQKGTLHLSTTVHLPCFISFRGKKSRQILFEHTGTDYLCIKLLWFLYMSVNLP